MGMAYFSLLEFKGVKRRMVLVVNVFRIFEILNFCFVVAICDLVHDMQTIFRHP